ncbi:hydrolase [Microbulbifer sp. 2205BS26-8]|uniref:hydrolase n=1 Tax=Microbulbifer sp. 2205BS26-8 TaxID=3064386 RepID=UPI00273DC219|nr:hydrolase [Microbulbifer sp. 2205BS26-8]MDP5209075.1 hydrolase [Microbulbifer sp. 2205BS26-8]
MTEKFSPAAGLGNCHLQTVFGRFHRPSPWIGTDCRWYETPDGDCLALHAPHLLEDDPSSPLVLVLHGLEGSVASPYVQGLMASLLERQFQVAVMHFRGCGGIPNRLPRAYHSGDSEDPRWLVDQLQEAFPSTPIMVVGYSLGGNVLLKMLGEDGACSRIVAAVAVSSPMDLHACSRRINTGLSKLYQRHLLGCLRMTLRQKAADPGMAAALPNVDDGASFVNFRRFDHVFTAPLHGFRSVDDYYTQASSKPLLRDIRVPTLIINAIDDPFVCPSAIPSQREVSSAVRLEVSERGGHVGFVSGSLWQPTYWLEETIPRFLCSVIGGNPRVRLR